MDGSDPYRPPDNESKTSQADRASPGPSEPRRRDHDGADSRATQGGVPPSRVVLFAALAVLGATADLWTKSAVFSWRGLPGEQDVWWIIDHFFGIETAVNIGAVFGVGAGKGTLFAAFSIVAAVGIVIWLFWFKAAQSLWLTWALGLIGLAAYARRRRK